MFENSRWRFRAVHCLFLLLTLSLTLGAAMLTDFTGDPGVRGGAAGAGGQLPGLTVKESKFFDAGLDAFTEVQSVTGSIPGTEAGLGPRFNLDSCGGCHSQPAIGGTSPAVNPQGAAAGDEFRTAPLWGLGQRIFSCMTEGRRISWTPFRRIQVRVLKPTDQWVPSTHSRPPTNKIF